MWWEVCLVSTSKSPGHAVLPLNFLSEKISEWECLTFWEFLVKESERVLLVQPSGSYLGIGPWRNKLNIREKRFGWGALKLLTHLLNGNLELTIATRKCRAACGVYTVVFMPGRNELSTEKRLLTLLLCQSTAVDEGWSWSAPELWWSCDP